MRIKYFIAIALSVASGFALRAQETIREMELLTVNDQITTVITATEPVRFVDISTDKVAGDQPLSNTVRLKPKEGAEVNQDGDILAVVTIITERYRVQYALVYTTRPHEAVTDKAVLLTETVPYNNPAVSLSTEDMTRMARRIWTAKAKYRNVGTKKNHLEIRLNNIYTAGEWFFIDFSVENRTNIRFDIDQIRFKVEDKRKSRATNDQSVELSPALLLEQGTTFNRGYRNVAVLKKLTFPNDKVLTIEMSEKQVSGRTITLEIDYEDVLRADSFDYGLLEED